MTETSEQRELHALRDTLRAIGEMVGVTKDSPEGERSVTVAVHALICRARDVVACFKLISGTGSLYLEAPGVEAERALLALKELVAPVSPGRSMKQEKE